MRLMKSGFGFLAGFALCLGSAVSAEKASLDSEFNRSVVHEVTAQAGGEIDVSTPAALDLGKLTMPREKRLR